MRKISIDDLVSQSSAMTLDGSVGDPHESGYFFIGVALRSEQERANLCFSGQKHEMRIDTEENQ